MLYMKLKGKRVVITGASSGLGKALLKQMLHAGARIIGVARHIEPIIEEFGARGVQALACDVSQPAEVDTMLTKATDLLGGIDVFVANAGFAYFGTIGKADWEKTERIFRTNVISPIYTLQKLTENGRTEPLTFMITVSALGKMVLPGYSLYDSTKFALDGFVRTYRMERPKNVRIIPVYPVANFTDFFRKAGGDDTPMPLLARQLPQITAFCMKEGIRLGVRSVYPSIIFIIRCLLVRVTPADLLVQWVERPRFYLWRKRHNDLPHS